MFLLGGEGSREICCEVALGRRKEFSFLKLEYEIEQSDEEVMGKQSAASDIWGNQFLWVEFGWGI